MPVSPADFALWARETGNKYPETTQEKLAATPHAYAHARSFGKASTNAPGARVGGSILYDQPVVVENRAPNSLFNSPVTPDNRASKVAGTLDATLTGEQFRNEEGQEVAERSRQRSFIDTLGKTALAAGAVAAGVALAQNPAAQQAIRTAGTSISENAQNIGSRVSGFLGGLGGGRNVDPDVIRNSGDVTPPTTGQRYQQEQIPVATQEIQVAKGAPTGSMAEATLPPTTESYGAKPVTESDVITSSQTFAPRSKSEVIQSVLSKMPLSTQETEYAPDILDPRDFGTQSFQTATKFASPEVIAARRADLRGEVNPSVGAPLVDRVTGEIRNPEISVAGYKEAFPGIGERVKDFLQPETGAAPIGVSTGEYGAQLALPGLNGGSNVPLNTTEEKYSWNDPSRDLPPAAWKQAKEHQLELFFPHHPRTMGGYGDTNILSPTRHEKVDYRPLGGRSLVRTGGGAQPGKVTIEHPYSYEPKEQRDIGEFAVSGARDVTSSTNKAPQRFAGERDIEASLATQETQGVFPTGQFSSLASGEQYEPAILHRLSSMIDPRVVTQGEQGARSKVAGYLGGKASWMQQAGEEAELRRQAGLQESTQRLGALEQDLTRLERTSDLPEVERRRVAKTRTFLRQAAGLFGMTQDPALLEAASQLALPLTTTLPGGETVPTKSLFKPFSAVGSGKGENLTQVQALENDLIGKQTVLSNVRYGALRSLGLKPTVQLSRKQFDSLPESTRTVLKNAHKDLAVAQNKLDDARASQILFSVPENIVEGTKQVPVFNQTTGDIIGMTSAPEEKTLDPIDFYNMRARSGVGRSEVGGVGRRREALADLGYSPEGAVSDVTPVLFKDLNTGEILHADDVLPAQYANKSVRPVRGTAVEPQRLMGKRDRSYKGITSDVIDPRSFDPVERQKRAEERPDLITPEGLLYMETAAERPIGYTPPGMGAYSNAAMKRALAGPTPEQVDENLIQLALSSPGGRLQARAQTAPRPAPAEGSARAKSVALLKQRSEMINQIMRGESVDLPSAPSARPQEVGQTSEWIHGPKEAPKSNPTVRTVREARPQQLSIPGAGLASQIRSTPALEEALATERYMGSRPGTNLRAAMQKALAKASVQQPTLF